MKPRGQAKSSRQFPSPEKSKLKSVSVTISRARVKARRRRRCHRLSMGTTAGAGLDPLTAAEKAVSIIGFGYDANQDIRLANCKSGPSGSRLIDLDPNSSRDLAFPGEAVVPNVPNSIKCYKGERLRLSSGVLSFDQVFNLYALILKI
ncbi:hypothetical protein L6164_032880 [Bauhinia variegata]|uniref:Uncharacterized protein n=1 Tax=Bauhinia variegata TaxID=167791 RepID=A0ACB9KQ80_BAUVA|nr:hypothetical protein L6164_032880 [Bauhinia variegata]